MITFSELGRYGRLGNQLFQYAALRGVEAATGFEAVVPPGFAIAGLSLRARAAAVAPRARYAERGFAFDPAVFAVADGTDLHGYFQSPRYFARVAPLLAREFALAPAPAARAAAALAAWRADGAELVGVHVRRGDYLRYPRVHPVLEPAWYARALAALPPLAPGRARRLVVCSDDPAWCRAALGGLGAAAVSEGLAPVEDLGVLAGCDHVVISNSSFAWWGAWLNPQPGRVVVAPAPWFGPDGYQDTQDLLPAGWRVVPR